MKRVIILAMAILFSAMLSIAGAADQKFSWKPNVDAGITTGYKIHYGIASKTYTKVVDVGFPTAVNGRILGEVKGFPEGVKYFFAVTAYNKDGAESAYSTEVSLTAAYPIPGAPADLKQENVVINISASTVKINVSADLAAK